MSSVGFRVFSYHLCGTAKVQQFFKLPKKHRSCGSHRTQKPKKTIHKWQNSSTKNSTLSSSK
nr:MAG TPA: hypothetical protein [Caudoviricetes sp.]